MILNVFDKKNDVKKEKYIEVDPLVRSEKKGEFKKFNIQLASPVEKKTGSELQLATKILYLDFKKVVVIHYILV